MRGLCENCIHHEVCDFYRQEGTDGFTMNCPFHKEDRPHGEWVIRRDKQGAHIYSVCSKCNVPYLDTDFPNFCPNCGADMRKEGDEK